MQIKNLRVDTQLLEVIHFTADLTKPITREMRRMAWPHAIEEVKSYANQFPEEKRLMSGFESNTAIYQIGLYQGDYRFEWRLRNVHAWSPESKSFF